MAIHNLKQVRREKAVTQKRLAELSGVNRGTIAYYETVAEINPSHVMLRKLADALGVTPDDLVDARRKNQIFDWREDFPGAEDTPLLQGVPSYVLERPEVQRVTKNNPRDRRLELLKLWEYMPGEQHRVTVLSLFYGEEDLSQEFGSWEALIPAQRKWEKRFLRPEVRTDVKVRTRSKTALTGEKRASARTART